MEVSEALAEEPRGREPQAEEAAGETMLNVATLKEALAA